MVARVSMGALAARATWLQVRPWFRFMRRPSATSSPRLVPVRRRNRRALPSARGKASSRARSRRSTMALVMTRWGAPSIARVTVVPVTGVAR